MPYFIRPDILPLNYLMLRAACSTGYFLVKNRADRLDYSNFDSISPSNRAFAGRRAKTPFFEILCCIVLLMSKTYARKGSATGAKQITSENSKVLQTLTAKPKRNTINRDARATPASVVAAASTIVRHATTNVKISDIILTCPLQPRLFKNDNIAKEYAKMMRSGDTFPPPVLTRDTNGTLRVADGRYRIDAYRKLGRKNIEAIVVDGDANHAYVLGLQANIAHGAQLTRTDKRANVDRLLTDKIWNQWSDNEIAKICGVDHKTAGSRRAQLVAAGKCDAERETCLYKRNGKTHQMDVRGKKSDRNKSLQQAAEESENSAKIPEGALDAYEKWKSKIKTARRFAIKSKHCAGYHVIALGDSTDEQCVKSLFGTKRAGLYLTDPPYNASIQSNRTCPTAETEEYIANNKLSDAAFKDLLQKVFELSRKFLSMDAGFYIWAAFPSFQLKMSLIETIFGKSRQPLIWVKKRFVYHSRYDYSWGHEICLYGWLNKAKRVWFAEDSPTTVFAGKIFEGFEHDAKPKSHPCPKPVLIAKQFIENSLERGKIVYDSFLGSGSTLIAAELAGRLCYGVELIPEYFALVLERVSEVVDSKDIHPVPDGMNIDDFLKMLPVDPLDAGLDDSNMDMGLAK